MHSFLAFLFVAGTLLTGESATAQSILTAKDSLKSKSLEQKWLRYVHNPSEQTAEAVMKLLPPCNNGDSLDVVSFNSQLLESISTHEMVLAKEIHRGRREALDLALSLYLISDGDLAESLSEIAGEAVPMYPRMFLEALEKALALCPSIDISSFLFPTGRNMAIVTT